jgi:hypothetical protein
MAAVAKTITPSVCTPLPVDSDRLPPLPLGEDVAAGDACYIKNDGKIWRSIGTTLAAPAAEVHGYAPISGKAAQRQTMSLYLGVDFAYGPNNLTPGSYLFLSGTTAGGLDTIASTGGTKAVALVVKNEASHSIVRVFRSQY